MSKNYLCLTSKQGYKARVRVDHITEYGELQLGEEDEKYDFTEGARNVCGSYVNTTYAGDESFYVEELVEELDEAMEVLGYNCLSIQKGHHLKEIHIQTNNELKHLNQEAKASCEQVIKACRNLSERNSDE